MDVDEILSSSVHPSVRRGYNPRTAIKLAEKDEEEPYQLCLSPICFHDPSRCRNCNVDVAHAIAHLYEAIFVRAKLLPSRCCERSPQLLPTAGCKSLSSLGSISKSVRFANSSRPSRAAIVEPISGDVGAL